MFLIKVIQFTVNYFPNIIEFGTIPAVQQLKEIIRQDLEEMGFRCKKKLVFCLVTPVHNPIYLFSFNKFTYFANATIDDVSKIARLNVNKVYVPYCAVPQHGIHVNYDLPFLYDNEGIRNCSKNIDGIQKLKQELDEVTKANQLHESAFITGPMSNGLTNNRCMLFNTIICLFYGITI